MRTSHAQDNTFHQQVLPKIGYFNRKWLRLYKIYASKLGKKRGGDPPPFGMKKGLEKIFFFFF